MNTGISTMPAAAFGNAKLGAPGRSINSALKEAGERTHPKVREGEGGPFPWPLTRNVRISSKPVIVAMTEHALTAGGATPPAKLEGSTE